MILYARYYLFLSHTSVESRCRNRDGMKEECVLTFSYNFGFNFQKMCNTYIYTYLLLNFENITERLNLGYTSPLHWDLSFAYCVAACWYT